MKWHSNHVILQVKCCLSLELLSLSYHHGFQVTILY